MTCEPGTDTSIWFYEMEGKQAGPVPENGIRALIAGGQLNTSNLVWRKGLADWIAVEHSELRDVPTQNTPDGETQNDIATCWYYERDGKRVGPTSASQMGALIDAGTLTYGSLVWRMGMPSWAAVENTDLGQLVRQLGPPPLTGEAVNNAVVWLLAVSPLFSLMLQYAIALHASNGYEVLAERLVGEGRYWYIPALLSIALSYWDVFVLKRAGLNVKLLGQAWLIPVYLFKRAKMLQHSPAYGWVWILFFVMGLIVAMSFADSTI